MRAAEFLPDVQETLERRGEPAYRLGQAYGALINLLIRDWEEAPAAVLDLRRAREHGLSATLRPSRGEDIDAACGQLAAKDLRGRPAALSR